MALPSSDATPVRNSRVLDEPSFQRRLHRATATLLFALGVPMLILLALSLFLYRSAAWVDHTDRVISQATEIDRLLVTMQTGFRGYRLSGDEAYLQPFTQARTRIASELELLAGLTADNPIQVQNVAQMRANLAAWLTFVDDQLEATRAGRTRVNDPAFLATGAPIFQRNQDVITALVAREAGLRFLRERNLERWATVTLTVFGLAALVGIPTLSVWLQRRLRGAGDSYRSALQAAERRASELEVTLTSIGDAVVATDVEGRVEFLNPAAEALMGWTRQEARGRFLPEVFQIFNEHSGLVVENPVERVLRGNVVVGLANHTVLRARDRTERPIEDSAAPIRSENGELLGVILVFHDVSSKREKERLLRESEERLRVLSQLSEGTRLLSDPAQIVAMATQILGTHLHVSRCAYAEVAEDGEHFTILQDYTDGCVSTVGDYRLSLFGRRATSLREGEPLVVRDVAAELLPAEGGDMFRALGIQATICHPLMRDGALRAMMAVHQAGPRRWTAGEIKLVGEVVERCRASIEQVRAEANLLVAHAAAAAAAREVAEAAERFRLLAHVVSLQVWTANVNGELDYANQECAQYFGVDVGRDVLGNGWVQFVHLDDLPTALRGWQTALATGERYEVEFRLRSASGEFRWFMVRAQAMRDADGKIAKWFGTNTDIDELKRAQADAEQASRAKDDFIATLSHELRTPLTPVLMTAAALRDDERLLPEIREQLGMIERNIALEARLIDDLLDVTTITRGKLRLRAQPSDAHSLIGLAAEIVRDEALAKEVTIDRRMEAQRSGLILDPARFQQVIWNLLRNAVKFTPRGGRVALRTRDHIGADGDPWLLIEVVDSGIGIDAVDLEKIFLPFEQGVRAGDHRFGGIGLGLAIARAIVELHGGHITARSEGRDQGATFVIELPGASDPPHGVSARQPSERNAFLGVPAASPRPTPPSPSLRLLLVEDHEATLQVLARLLAAAGHRVLTARTISEALDLAQREKFELVISDLGLPDGTGAELMEKLRDQYGLRGIALSGYGMEEDLARSKEAGFSAHLIKPVDFNQLRRVLAEVAK